MGTQSNRVSIYLTDDGRRIGAKEHMGIWGHTNLLSSVRRTATPASTLPTVSEMSIAIALYVEVQRG